MKAKVLVVDDENDVRQLIVETLIDFDYVPVDVSSAVGIVETVLREQPDIILMDITMPEIDGLEALRLLKANAATASVPVIMASAQARNEVLVKARHLGATDFLIKPWQEGELEWRVSNALAEVSKESA